jgi:phenylpropionate dioxygenase-like ring-hydroxylating dioxygenase large terminal subunit
MDTSSPGDSSDKRNNFSVARLPKAWYVATASGALKKTPISTTILGIPLVLFRDTSGTPKALIDRCPHRNAKLSSGQVQGDNLQCRYHGWTFNKSGRCVDIPGFCDEPNNDARRVVSFPVCEQDGYVWVYPEADAQPQTKPEAFDLLHAKGYHALYFNYRVQATMHATLENILDVPHTAFIHKGLFRSSANRQEIQAIIRRSEESVEVEFVGEPRPGGLIGKMLAPSGGIVEHHDRFRLPSIAEVEYRLGSENHLLARNYLTPISDFETHVHLSLAARLRIPAFLVRFVAKRLALRLLKQDQSILLEQRDNIQRFEGERYASSELDVLGPQMLQILRQAERGALKVPVGQEEKTICMKL